MVPTWALALVLCASPAWGAGLRYQGREEGGGVDIQLNPRSGMIQFIIHKGCDYVSSFVWSHYIKQRHDKDDHVNHRRFLLEPKCDWKNPVRKALDAANVPVELGNALIDCGPSFSFHAVQIRDWNQLFSTCNMSVHDAHHGVVITGRRGASENNSFLESETSSDMAKEQTFKMDYKMPRAEQHLSSIHGASRGDSWLASDHIVQSDSLFKWCSYYSRSVNRKFHLDRKRFVRSSPHWLVDVYKMAKKFSTPKSYIHGLVGCGQEYALAAFGVPKRISLLYSSD